MDYLALKEELSQGIDTELFNEDGLTEEGQDVITKIETAFKAVDDIKKALREKVLQQMKDRGILKITAGNVKVTYKDAYDREGIDTARLKEEAPLIYDEYSKVTPVKESLVVKVG